jgi:hypothetical protein
VAAGGASAATAQPYGLTIEGVMVANMITMVFIIVRLLEPLRYEIRKIVITE